MQRIGELLDPRVRILTGLELDADGSIPLLPGRNGMPGRRWVLTNEFGEGLEPVGAWVPSDLEANEVAGHMGRGRNGRRIRALLLVAATDQHTNCHRNGEQDEEAPSHPSRLPDPAPAVQRAERQLFR